MKQLAFHTFLEASRAVQAFLGCLMFRFLLSTDVEQKLLKPNSSTSVRNILQTFAQIRKTNLLYWITMSLFKSCAV